MQIKKEACKTRIIVFSVDPEFAIYLWKDKKLVSAILRLIQDLMSFSETILKLKKSGLKTEIGLEMCESNKLKFDLEEKSLNHAKK